MYHSNAFTYHSFLFFFFTITLRVFLYMPIIVSIIMLKIKLFLFIQNVYKKEKCVSFANYLKTASPVPWLWPTGTAYGRLSYASVWSARRSPPTGTPWTASRVWF